MVGTLVYSVGVECGKIGPVNNKPTRILDEWGHGEAHDYYVMYSSWSTNQTQEPWFQLLLPGFGWILLTWQVMHSIALFTSLSVCTCMCPVFVLVGFFFPSFIIFGPHLSVLRACSWQVVGVPAICGAGNPTRESHHFCFDVPYSFEIRLFCQQF